MSSAKDLSQAEFKHVRHVVARCLSGGSVDAYELQAAERLLEGNYIDIELIRQTTQGTGGWPT